MIGLLIWLRTIIISYLLFRSAIKRMNWDDKTMLPIFEFIIFMLMPFINMILCTIIWIMYCSDILEYDKAHIVDKIFFIKGK
jgi:hypothetical protein